MKIKVDLDESMRMYIIPDDDKYRFSHEIEVPEELITRFKNAEKEFMDVDDELYQLYLKQKKQ